MNLKSNFLIKSIFILTIIFQISCTKNNEKVFEKNPKNTNANVMSICLKTDASHFTVNNQIVNFKKIDSNIIRLKHFKTLLPDGYYFCSLQSGNSNVLD